LKGIIPIDLEKIALLKNILLQTLSNIALNNNLYIASIFHNVLMLYYLNRNPKVAQHIIDKIKNKTIILDTNTFYAFQCKASEFHDIVLYSISKLSKMGASISIYDVSVKEYNESLRIALNNYRNTKAYYYIHKKERPWIWKEFESNSSGYKYFDSCVLLHHVPPYKKVDYDEDDFKNNLKANGIIYKKLEPYLDKKELGELFNQVWDVKLKLNPETGKREYYGSIENYESRVIHDANCLKSIVNIGENPFDSQAVFVTCDYSLIKIRKIYPGQYESLVTITEYYEFMIPYLFLTDTITDRPLEMPNFLLAASIAYDLHNTLDFETLVGEFLINQEKISKKDYSQLLQQGNNERFKSIKEKQSKILIKDDSKDTEKI
jgi:hypothetical protein